MVVKYSFHDAEHGRSQFRQVVNSAVTLGQDAFDTAGIDTDPVEFVPKFLTLVDGFYRIRKVIRATIR